MKSHHERVNYARIALVAVGLAFLANTSALAAQLTGTVQIAKQSIAGSTVTLFAAGAGAPKQLAQGKSDGSGAFDLTHRDAPPGDVLYVVAKGGTPKAGKGASEGLVLMSLLGTAPPTRVTINELTTVASAYTAARFFRDGGLSGDPLGLRIAAGNSPNLVDPVTGGWGSVLLDPLKQSLRIVRRVSLQPRPIARSPTSCPLVCKRFLITL